MKANEILQALNLPKTKENTGYCSTLANICKLIIELKKDSTFTATLSEIKTAKELIDALPVMPDFTSHNRINQWQSDRYTTLNNINNFEQYQPLQFTTNTGKYSVNVPTDNEFYNYITSLCGLCEIAAKKETVLFEISLNSNVLINAANHCGNDSLRPEFMHVLLHNMDNELQIISTDAHCMFMSQKIETDCENEYQILIPATLCKGLKKNNNVKVQILAGGKISVNGKVGINDFCKFPEYWNVIPQDNQYSMDVESSVMLSNLSQIMVAADRNTNRVTFSINGHIDMLCEDLDFETKSIAAMDYIVSNVPDMEIAFNGKLLAKCLKTFDKDNITFSTSGLSTRAVIMNGCHDSILLMPIELYKY